MNKRLLLMMVMTVAGVLLFAGLACSDDDDEVTPTDTAGPTATETNGSPTETSTETAEPTETDAATASPTEEPFSGGRDPVEKAPPTVPPVAIQTDTRYAAHGDFDRVVFDFRDNSPGYRIEYVEPPILADGSGLEVEVEGEAFLQVRLEAAQAHDDAGNPTIGEMEIMPEGLPSVVEIQMTGDFEGYVTWVIGLPEELDFRVADLTDPFRVVIDIAHP